MENKEVLIWQRCINGLRGSQTKEEKYKYIDMLIELESLREADRRQKLTPKWLWRRLVGEHTENLPENATTTIAFSGIR